MKLNAILSASLIAASVFAAGAANAASYLPFDINTSIAATTTSGGSSSTPYKLDEFGGSYFETVTFTSANTFAVSIGFNLDAGKYLGNSKQGFFTKLGNQYDLLGTFMGAGSFTSSGGVNKFKLDPTTTSLNLYLNNYSFSGAPSEFNAPPLNGSTAYITTTDSTNELLATGVGIWGSGNNQTCDSAKNCGSFGQQTTFVLTALGSKYFVQPAPIFYPFSFETGNFNEFLNTAPGTIQTQGQINVHFGDVPEPASLALVGLGLLGLGLSRRRKS